MSVCKALCSFSLEDLESAVQCKVKEKAGNIYLSSTICMTKTKLTMKHSLHSECPVKGRTMNCHSENTITHQ